ncbi:uncharacterized protein LOC133662287 [Entelurus aequoreus]|uniref:uncharacterized protein LOC133662287 n=1 Tax=Entelurus aequoreus TaxID=161455 RepID=UPI002B1DBBC7|nr:uncharacterized protein LOC133662287 [Entelurus aequoreus]
MAQRARTHVSLSPPGCLVPSLWIQRPSARLRWAALHLELAWTTHARTEAHPCRIKCWTSGRKTLPLWRLTSQGMFRKGALLRAKGGSPVELIRALTSRSPRLGFLRGRLLLVQEAPELSPEEGSGIPSLPQGREQGSHGRYKVLPPGADPVEPQQLGLHQSRVGVSGVEAGFVEEGMGIRLFKKHLNVQMVSGGEIRTLEGGSVQEVH